MDHDNQITAFSEGLAFMMDSKGTLEWCKGLHLNDAEANLENITTHTESLWKVHLKVLLIFPLLMYNFKVGIIYIEHCRFYN